MNIKKLLILFLSWRVLLLVFIFFGMSIFCLQQDFLGGGDRFFENPVFWSQINFDGEHYLSISYKGYQNLEYFYFPLYPLLVSIISKIFGGTYDMHAFAGLVISHLLFLLSLLGFYKLLRLDYKDKFSFKVISLLLLFPMAFYFVSYYTESLFLALVVWSFYFARRGNWLFAGVLGGLLTATRIVGLALLPALLFELYLQNKKKLNTPKNIINLFCILLIPVGFVGYVVFLQVTTGDPLAFFNQVEIFGDQRSSSLVLLPQVFYRYVFKILPSLPLNYFPALFVTIMEFTVGVVFLVLSLLAFKKLRSSYAVYLLIGYLIPTLSGSFSSLPRYVLVLFPGFLLLAHFIEKLPRIISYTVYLLMFVGLAISTAMFTRGYWIS